MRICDVCGNYVEDFETIHNSVICKDCLERDDYTFCEECNCVLFNEDATIIEGKYYCDDCHIYCADCECAVPISESNETRYGNVCDNCYENYFYCDRCGTVDNFENGTRFCDNWYCEDCYDSVRLEYGIHTYQYKPSPKFYEMEGEPTLRKNNLHIGIELEIQGVDNLEFCGNLKERYTYDDDVFYMKQDGSLDESGVEIVSMPMTLDFIINSNDWAYCFEQMEKCRMNDTDGCGLHFHLDKKYLNKDIIAVIDFIVNNYNEYFERYCGRSYGYYCRKQNKSRNDWGKNITSRYSAVNLTNINTVELRFCKSTANFDTFIKRVKLIFAIVDFAKNNNLEDIYDLTLEKFTKRFTKHFNKMFGDILGDSLDD